MKLKIKSILKQDKIGALVFILLFGITYAFIGHPQKAVSITPTIAPDHIRPPQYTGRKLDFSANLSQNKLIQGQSGNVFVEFEIAAPNIEFDDFRKAASDFIVVLDKSGSMSDAGKMPYAKAAIRDLLSQLNENDRIALVTFDAHARVAANINFAGSNHKRLIQSAVDRIRPGGSTNISDAINKAKYLLRGSDRNAKIMLLSDGNANHGITNHQQLCNLVSHVSEQGAVVSTVGMGLGFNERLLSSLADYGMGSYSFLESLEDLGSILAKSLADAKAIYAKSSFVTIEMGNGISLVDAAGYPQEFISSGRNSVKLRTGQLLAGNVKKFITTLNVPTHRVNELKLLDARVNYVVNGQNREVNLSTGPLQVAILPQSQKDEAVASINDELFNKSWQLNNIGVVKKKVREALSAGDKMAARASIASFEREVKEQAANAPAKLDAKKISNELQVMQEEVDYAFTGSSAEQRQKQNRLGKSFFSDAISAQRSN